MTAITVLAPFAVVHEGKRYVPGDTPDIPDAIARDWIAQGWAEKPKPAPAKSRASKS
jgi:hypothetical protein